jgi:hypothetical protein
MCEIASFDALWKLGRFFPQYRSYYIMPGELKVIFPPAGHHQMPFLLSTFALICQKE